ncbi:MAG: radical SAM protein [Candidatus Thorarchaeota archaeon]
MWRVLRPDSSRVWKDQETLKRLSRYRGIIDSKYWAKYLLADDIGCTISLESTLEELWTVHSDLNDEFADYVTKVDQGKDRIKRDPQLSSLLDLKNEIAQRILQDCHFCERRCGINRLQDETGWCKLGASSRVSSAFLHTGEEAPLVPSGTIFFSSCCLACVFCQNADISTQPDSGQIISEQELAAVAEELRKDGAININYVGGDPVPNTHTIIGSLRYQTSNVTQLWNSSMFCSEETMNLLMGLMDVWLPDFKYGNNECGERLSGVKSYFDIVSRNHLMAYESGEVIIRHLVLPNHIECCTIPLLEWIAKNLPNCMVNIMAQYRPEYRILREPEQFSDLTTRVSNTEMQQAFDKANELGICWRPVS